MQKTKIDWADMTWNPVTGCLHGCEYCYARKIARRFAPKMSDGKPSESGELHTIGNTNIPFSWGFDPTFHQYRLSDPQKIKKPQTIFVCSMADLFGKWVPDEWIESVFTACKAAPQHRYLFLTKYPARYRILQSKGALPTEHWYGTTATVNSEYFSHSDYRTFVSIEPMLRPVVIDRRPQQILPDWVIIGAETGNRKDKVIPEMAWIEDVLSDCKFGYVPIFMKESLRSIMGDDFIQEFPWSTT